MKRCGKNVVKVKVKRVYTVFIKKIINGVVSILRNVVIVMAVFKITTMTACKMLKEKVVLYMITKYMKG